MATKFVFQTAKKLDCMTDIQYGCSRKVDCQVEECYTGGPILLYYAAVVFREAPPPYLTRTFRYILQFFFPSNVLERKKLETTCLCARKANSIKCIYFDENNVLAILIYTLT